MVLSGHVALLGSGPVTGTRRTAPKKICPALLREFIAKARLEHVQSRLAVHTCFEDDYSLEISAIVRLLFTSISHDSHYGPDFAFRRAPIRLRRPVSLVFLAFARPLRLRLSPWTSSSTLLLTSSPV